MNATPETDDDERIDPDDPLAINLAVPADDVSRFKADDRGRVTLGKEWANRSISIGVLERAVRLEDDDQEGDE